MGGGVRTRFSSHTVGSEVRNQGLGDDEIQQQKSRTEPVHVPCRSIRSKLQDVFLARKQKRRVLRRVCTVLCISWARREPQTVFDQMLHELVQIGRHRFRVPVSLWDKQTQTQQIIRSSAARCFETGIGGMNVGHTAGCACSE